LTFLKWLSVFLLVWTQGSQANQSYPGEIQPEPATLQSLSVRWPIRGDENRNAVVHVYYRKSVDTDWNPGYPLFRRLKEATPEQQRLWQFNDIDSAGLEGGWIFAGSIVDLEPDTEYQVKLLLEDPDGGGTERILTMKTWAEPAEPKGMRIRHVVPGKGGGQGTEEDPLRGLTAADQAARPGDLFLLHAGTYIRENCPENTWNLTRSGLPGRPIIYRAAGDGAVILDGGGGVTTEGEMIQAPGIEHVWLEGLTLQGRETAIRADRSSHWVIRRCHFRNIGRGFTALHGGYDISRHHFISDNLFQGPTTWPRSKGIESYSATYMTGAGHVVSYNRIEHMGDAIHGSGRGNLSASDYHNNDIRNCTDDGIETDYGVTNVRVYRNRIVNVIHGVTAQPAQGGPIYIFRNVIYNAVFSPFKLHNHTAGVLFFHNTSIRDGDCFRIVPSRETVTDVTTRNNLFLGTGEKALHTSARFIRCDFDSDGYGGYTGPFAFLEGQLYPKPEIDGVSGSSFYTGRSAIRVDPEGCFEGGLMPPDDPDRMYEAEELDFTLSPSSGAVDQGVPIPNFNDRFTGKGPDLGAYERGMEAPHYGPRSR